MNPRIFHPKLLRWLLLATLWSLLIQHCAASIGDRLPDFRECVKVRDRDLGNANLSSFDAGLQASEL
jgi:hypothetical protein